MTLSDLKSYIESLPDNYVFRYSLSNPFSWRGDYAEVCFSVEEQSCTRKDLLEKIEKALTREFMGYKGGEFRYNEDTYVHFEEYSNDYSNGEYTEKIISKLLNMPEVASPERRLINLLFPTP